MQSFIEYQGGKIHFIDQGNGPVLFLLHGFLEQKSMWKKFIEALSKRYRVIAPDLPGHGQSSLMSGDISMDAMADHVEALRSFLDIPQMVIIGHSMGGYVAQNYAQRYAQHIAGYGYFHSHASADSPEAKINRGRAMQVVKENHASFISHFIPELFTPENQICYKQEIEVMKNQAAQMTKEAIIHALTAMRERKDGYGLLKKCNKPIMFIIGKQDSRAPMEDLKEQIFSAKKSHVLILENCAHMGFLEDFESCLHFVSGFTSSCYRQI